jgi:hypothetical protein
MKIEKVKKLYGSDIVKVTTELTEAEIRALTLTQIGQVKIVKIVKRVKNLNPGDISEITSELTQDEIRWLEYRKQLAASRD